jgi:hypothetical protein
LPAVPTKIAPKHKTSSSHPPSLSEFFPSPPTLPHHPNCHQAPVRKPSYLSIHAISSSICHRTTRLRTNALISLQQPSPWGKSNRAIVGALPQTIKKMISEISMNLTDTLSLLVRKRFISMSSSSATSTPANPPPLVRHKRCKRWSKVNSHNFRPFNLQMRRY